MTLTALMKNKPKPEPEPEPEEETLVQRVKKAVKKATKPKE